MFVALLRPGVAVAGTFAFLNVLLWDGWSRSWWASNRPSCSTDEGTRDVGEAGPAPTVCDTCVSKHGMSRRDS